MNHHPAIVRAEIWDAVQLRFKGNSEKHNANVSDVAEREEDGLAMAEDWCGPKETLLLNAGCQIRNVTKAT